jgi:hypothetical protein
MYANTLRPHKTSKACTRLLQKAFGTPIQACKHPYTGMQAKPYTGMHAALQHYSPYASRPTDPASEPSGWNATLYTCLLCPSCSMRHDPVSMSQKRHVMS